MNMNNSFSSFTTFIEIFVKCFEAIHDKEFKFKFPMGHDQK